ncbi:MAG: hypothetical protein WAW41_04105 [Methylobacter sp.]
MKLSPYQLTETLQLITDLANRKYKESLAEFHDPASEHYRDSEHCNQKLDSIFKQGNDQLEGIHYLLLDYSHVAAKIKKAREILEQDRGLIRALLIAGKHYKEAIFIDAKEVA